MYICIIYIYIYVYIYIYIYIYIGLRSKLDCGRNGKKLFDLLLLKWAKSSVAE